MDEHEWLAHKILEEIGERVLDVGRERLDGYQYITCMRSTRAFHLDDPGMDDQVEACGVAWARFRLRSFHQENVQ